MLLKKAIKTAFDTFGRPANLDAKTWSDEPEDIAAFTGIG
jgi:hypothetical protein